MGGRNSREFRLLSDQLIDEYCPYEKCYEMVFEEGSDKKGYGKHTAGLKVNIHVVSIPLFYMGTLFILGAAFLFDLVKRSLNGVMFIMQWDLDSTTMIRDD